MNVLQARRTLEQWLEQGEIEVATHRCGIDRLHATKPHGDQALVNGGCLEDLDSMPMPLRIDLMWAMGAPTDAIELLSQVDWSWWQGLYSPRQQHHQPMAKLAELKLKQVQQLNTEGSPLLIRKHKDVLNWMMRTFGLDTYGLTWAQFFKGVGLGALTAWLLLR